MRPHRTRFEARFGIETGIFVSFPLTGQESDIACVTGVEVAWLLCCSVITTYLYAKAY